MLKLLSIIIGGYILYRLFTNSNSLGAGQQPPNLDENDEEYVDYEEVE